MISSNFKTLTCLGCELKCDYTNSELFHDFKCDDKKRVVWPDDNYYFKFAVDEVIFKKYKCYLDHGVIIVDFSIYHLSLFLDDAWVDFLSRTELKVILIAGRRMLPLANFWAQKAGLNWFVVSNHGSLDEHLTYISRILRITKVKSSKHPSLNDNEMNTLRLMKKGCSNYDIAERLRCNIRDVYRLQHALRKKMCSTHLCRDILFKQTLP